MDTPTSSSSSGSNELLEELTPNFAASTVQSWLGLSEVEKDSLLAELLRTKKDLILAVKVNPAWIARHGAGETFPVIGAMAKFGMQEGVRRDDRSPGFLFRFSTSHDLYQCRISVETAYAKAFALSQIVYEAFGPDVHAALDASGVLINLDPMAFTAVIRQVEGGQCDAERFQFFYY